MDETTHDARASAATLAFPRLLLLENRKAGGGGESEIAQRLRETGREVLAPDTSSIEEACDITREKSGDVDLVVVAGGDGSVNGLLSCLMDLSVPMLVVPRGTGNDFARSLGIPLEGDEALSLLDTGMLADVDVSFANGKPFVNAASVGLTAQVTKYQTPERKSRFGSVSYIVSAFKAVQVSRPFRAEVVNLDEPDETPLKTRCVQLLAGNGRYFGGGMVVHHDTRIDDGKIYLYALKPASTFALILHGPLIGLGRVDLSPDAVVASGTGFRLKTRRPLPVHADGERLTQTPVTFEVKHRALKVLASKEFASQ
ncbi:YegS/Rv2252/BmrU family lipid kinase [Parvibaculum sp. MBR-TMA-1.3b-4.2]|jgi:YegS/Rv2252/BmrU family lipid kinase